MSLREPKKNSMFAALGIKRNPSASGTSTTTAKVDKKNKLEKVSKGDSVKNTEEEEGESDMEFVVVPDEKSHSKAGSRLGPSPAPSNIAHPKDPFKSGLPAPSTRSRNLTAPIAFRPTFDEPADPAVEDDSKGGSVRLRAKPGIAAEAGRGPTGLGRPKSSLGLGITTERIGSSVRVTSGSSREEDPKVERRRSMLWDRSAPSLKAPVGLAQGLRHKRSVSAIAGLSNPTTSSAGRPAAREMIKDVGETKRGQGLGEKKTGTGMLLRPRPGSEVVSKRASQIGSIVKPASSVRASKADPVKNTPVAIRLGAEDLNVEKRMSKRRSMMYLGQGPDEGLSAPIELKQSREILADESSGSTEELDNIHSKRQEALDRLMGNRLGVSGGNKTPVPARSLASARPAALMKSDTPSRRTRATTGKTHERAGSTPVVSRLMRAEIATSSKQDSDGNARNPSGVRWNMDSGAKTGTTTARARVEVSKRNVDLPGQSALGRASISTGSSTPMSKGSPQRGQQPPSTGTTPTRTPSRRDPLDRLRGTPNRSTDARTRKPSTESDIDLRLEQSRRTWLGGLGGGDKESPLTGKVGELRIGTGAGGSGRMKRMSSHGSGLGGGDVFGKPPKVDSVPSSIKIKELETKLEALQTQYDTERTTRLEAEQEEVRRRRAIEVMTDVVRACEEELKVLQCQREERGRQVGLFEKACELAADSV